MTLPFLPEALAEARRAILYYRRQDEGLGEDFRRPLDERLELAKRFPSAGRLERDAPAHFALRWFALRRFPYSVLVGSLGEERIVVAVRHDAREPGYWKDRLE